MIRKNNYLLCSLLIFGAGLFLSSCHLVQRTSPSILVIAVDHLGVNQLSCSSEISQQSRSGIAVLCQESVRFTHAFTTSPLSAPALTSILTAQYPYQHGLRSNTKSYLPSRVTTLPETAHKKGYATSFFSGGAPILRKLNLQQGFETFDDFHNPAPNSLFRPFRRSQKLFESWLEETDHSSFFSVIYVPDLAFVQTPTQNLLGENRPLTFESQLEEFDEALFELFKNLKDRKVWDSTVIVLTGLNGPDVHARQDEISSLNLFTEKTQVGLLIKPHQKPRDLGINWSFDANITLADVGATLGEFLGIEASSSGFPILSLTDVLKNTPSKAALDRPVLTESAWKGVDSVRYSVRWNQYLFLMDENPKFYNSLIDRQETSPIKISESGAQKEWDEIQKLMAPLKKTFWSPVSRDEFIKWRGLSEVFSSTPQLNSNMSFERLAYRLRDSQEISDLYVRELLLQQNWPELEKWSQGLKIADLERVAAKNLKKEHKKNFSHPCLAALELAQPQNQDIKKCEDPVALSLLEWILAERTDSVDASTKETFRKRFLRQYVLSRLDRKIAESNYALQGIWDLSPHLIQRNLTVELMLALPELQKQRQIATKAYQQTRDDSVTY